MLAEDFPRFETTVRSLEDMYGKKITDATMQTYWRALKDLPYEQIEERVRIHARFGKFFPKPMELRPKEDRPKENSAGDAAFAAAEQASVRYLEELRREDPKKWIKEVAVRHMARIYVSHARDSEVYQDYRKRWKAKIAEVCAGRQIS